MKTATDQIGRWLDEVDRMPMKRHGFAECALLTDYATVSQINKEVRSIAVACQRDVATWPEDQWIIGEDGAGGYFVISQSRAYDGVQFYDHEWRRFEPFQPNLRAYFDYCINIERSNR